MRIAHAHRALIAVLQLAVLFISASCRVWNNNNTSSFAPERFRHSRNFNLEWSQQLTLREKQLYIAQQSGLGGADESGIAGGGVDCCPSVMEMTEPIGGTNEKGGYVTLYRDADNHQRFYENSCADGVENRPCRFVDRKLHNQSRCVQQFSYSYALLEDTHHHHQKSQASLSIVGNTNSTGQTGWMLGYIKVRSGCRCTLFPKKAKKSKNKRLHHSDDTGGGGPT